MRGEGERLLRGEEEESEGLLEAADLLTVSSDESECEESWSKSSSRLAKRSMCAMSGVEVARGSAMRRSLMRVSIFFWSTCFQDGGTDVNAPPVFSFQTAEIPHSPVQILLESSGSDLEPHQSLKCSLATHVFRFDGHDTGLIRPSNFFLGKLAVNFDLRDCPRDFYCPRLGTGRRSPLFQALLILDGLVRSFKGRNGNNCILCTHFACTFRAT